MHQNAYQAVEIRETLLSQTTSDPGYTTIFRAATRRQKYGLIASAICAIIAGAVLPLMTIFVGSLAGKFVHLLRQDEARADLIDAARHLALCLVYLGIGSIVFTMLSTWGFTSIGESITIHLRQTYLSAVLQQDIAYFEAVGAGQITSHITHDMMLIQDGISQKVALVLGGISGFVCAIIISLVESWHFALVMLCMPVSLILVMGGFGTWMNNIQQKSMAAYAKTDDLAEEVLSSMRSIIAYGCEQRYSDKYRRRLRDPAVLDFEARVVLGVLMAGVFVVMHWGYGLAFWQGNRYLIHGQSTIAEIVTVVYATCMAGFLLGQVTPFFVAISQAGTAASRIFPVIERISPINPLSENGEKPTSVQGEIRFESVDFTYPSRSDQRVLKDFTLCIQPGQAVAVVGSSGSGKSTILALLERYYLPLKGQILLDNEPIDKLNLAWLRSQIGYVSQDIVLFNASIHDNIAYGLDTSFRAQFDQATIREWVIQAAEIAQIHFFITDIPEGYDAIVGQRGSLLSGGQRQRLGIARAIISNPKILLLDEATAALDSRSEKEVHKALDAAVQGRTTITIAHRISTIQNADLIVVMDNGRIMETGTHAELLSRHSVYWQLVQAQGLQKGGNKESSREWQTEKPVPESKHQGKKTASSTAKMDDSQEMTPSPPSWNGIKLVWSLSHPEWLHLAIGLFFSCLTGMSYPIHAIFFGNAVISMVDPSLSTGKHSVDFWALMYLIHGIITFCIYCGRGYCFAITSSQLGARARSNLFQCLLHKDLPFFDQKDHSTGFLVGFLSSGTTKLIGASGATLGAVVESTVTLITGIIVACVYGWKLGLIATATVPIILLCGFLQLWIITVVERHIKRDNRAGVVAYDAVSAIHTVAILGLEDTILRHFEQEADRGRQGRYWILFSSAYACSQGLCIFIIAFIFWYGGIHLIGSGEYTIQQFLVCFAAVVWGSQSAGALFSHAPDVAGAREAATQFEVLTTDLVSPCNTTASNCHTYLPVPHALEDISVRGVHFQYPSRPDRLVLNDVTINAPPGKFVALVGASGSGKSSVINLIERFYATDTGKIELENTCISKYNLTEFRRYLALVDQSPALVGETLRECLLSDDEHVLDEDILSVLRDVNLHDFVSSLPHGLNSPVGARGGKFSGGQKQRIAIAKALLRKPHILLLDEATSALDSNSEQIVQDALRAAAHGRTTIAVAHRLKSIAHADAIFVFENGRVVEVGTHDELTQARGRYWDMVRIQDLEGDR